MKYIKYIPVVALMIIAAFTRLIPHPFNFTAIGAIALFGGANIQDKRLAFLLPLLVMFGTDLFIGFHRVMIPVYSCFALTVLLGIFIQQRQNVKTIGTASILSSVVFFLVTNLSFWYGIRYPHTFAGAMESYTLSLPFLANQVAGDLFYNAVLFLAFALVKMRFPAVVKQDLKKKIKET
jgi:hypothetical protein